MKTRAKRSRQDDVPPQPASAIDDIMKIALPSGEVCEVSKASLDRHPTSLLRLMRDSEIPCTHNEQGAIQMTLPGNVSAIAFMTALDEYSCDWDVGASLRAPINPLMLHALYDFLLLPACLLSTERGRPNTPIDVIAGQAALHRGLALAQQLEVFIRGLSCPRLMQDAALACMPSLPDGAAAGDATTAASASMALLFQIKDKYGTDQLSGLDQLHVTGGDVHRMKSHEVQQRACFTREFFELLTCPARLQWVVRTFLPQRVDELRLLRARACAEADLALRPFVLEPRLLSKSSSFRTRWAGNHSPLTRARDLGVFAVRVPRLDFLRMVPNTNVHDRVRRQRLSIQRSLAIPTGPISRINVLVYWDDGEDEEAANARRYREGGFSVYVQAQARAPKTASLPVLGVEFDDFVRDSDEETDAVRAQARKAFFHGEAPSVQISDFLPAEEAVQRFSEIGGALTRESGSNVAAHSVIASPDGCFWATEVGIADGSVDTEGEELTDLLAADEEVFPRSFGHDAIGEASNSDALHGTVYKTVMITLSELHPDAHPTFKAHYQSLKEMGTAGRNPDNFLVVEVGSGVS
jgi:hypothetical protein